MIINYDYFANIFVHYVHSLYLWGIEKINIMKNFKVGDRVNVERILTEDWMSPKVLKNGYIYRIHKDGSITVFSDKDSICMPWMHSGRFYQGAYEITKQRDMKTITKHPLDIASDISETVYITTEDQNRSSKTTLINEYGDVAFECEIEVEHDYYNGDRNTGDAYEFNVTSVTVKVLNVFDSDGDVIAVNKIVMAQLEKTIGRNLNFEITKKY